MDTTRLQELYEEAGRPGARAFRTLARRKGEDVSTQQAQQFVAQQSSAQVLSLAMSPLPPSNAHS